MLLHRVVCDPGAQMAPPGEVSLNVKRDFEPYKSREWDTRLNNEPMLPIKTRSFVWTEIYSLLCKKLYRSVEVERAMVYKQVVLSIYFLRRGGKA